MICANVQTEDIYVSVCMCACGCARVFVNMPVCARDHACVCSCVCEWCGYYVCTRTELNMSIEFWALTKLKNVIRTARIAFSSTGISIRWCYDILFRAFSTSTSAYTYPHIYLKQIFWPRFMKYHVNLLPLLFPFSIWMSEIL